MIQPFSCLRPPTDLPVPLPIPCDRTEMQLKSSLVPFVLNPSYKNVVRNAQRENAEFADPILGTWGSITSDLGLVTCE